jgi:hypothetical protein
MNKSIILSVSQEEALNILSGEQTALLRKRIPKDYKGWVYGYVKKGKPYLVYSDDHYGHYYIEPRWTFLYGYSKEEAIKIFGVAKDDTFDGIINSTIPFRFWYDEYECYSDISGCTNNENGYECMFDFVYALHDYKDKLKELCLSYDEVEDYGNEQDLYVLKINKLEIFDKPMQLSEFYKHDCWVKDYDRFTPLSKTPKTYQYVYVKEKKDE